MRNARSQSRALPAFPERVFCAPVSSEADVYDQPFFVVLKPQPHADPAQDAIGVLHMFAVWLRLHAVALVW